MAQGSIATTCGWMRVAERLRYALIVNPASGRGRALGRADALAGILDESASVRVLHTTHRGAAMELSFGCAAEVDRVIAVGGDGTLNEVVAGLMAVHGEGQGLPEVGYLPAGTANVAASAFHLSTDPAAMARALPEATSRPLDVGHVRWGGGERTFLLWFGAGLDAVVIDALNTDRSGLMGYTGILGHLPHILRSVARYERPAISVSVDGAPWGEHASVVAANIGDVAFGGAVAKGADPGDGRLDVVGVPHASLTASLVLVYRMMRSSLTEGRGVRHATGRRVDLSAAGAVPFHVDGEPVGVLPATIAVVPSAVRLLQT